MILRTIEKLFGRIGDQGKNPFLNIRFHGTLVKNNACLVPQPRFLFDGIVIFSQIGKYSISHDIVQLQVMFF
jgi:hypothetical protein